MITKLAACLSFALTTLAATPLARAAERPTQAEVLPVMKQLFAGRTLVGDDGVTQAFAGLTVFGTTAWIEADVTKADGTHLHVIDSVLTDDAGKAILAEDVPSAGSSANYFVYLTAAGGLLVTPRPEDAAATSFVSRECWLEAAKTLCRKTVKGADGSMTSVMYRQQ